MWDNTLKYAVVASYSSIDSTLFWTQDFLWADTLGVIEDYDEGGSEELTGAVINGKTYGRITSVELKQTVSDDFRAINYPNPFNHSTKISYTLRLPAHVRIQIFDLLGKEVQAYDMGFQQAGIYDTLWQGDDHEGAVVTWGIYYIRSEHRILHRGSMTFVK